MMIIETRDGITITANTIEEVFTQLHKASFTKAPTLTGYIEATARASEMQTGKPHRTTMEGLFEDMIASGLLRRHQPQ